MPIDVAMHDPRSCIVGPEAYGDVVRSEISSIDDVAAHRVSEVVSVTPCTPHHTESMAVQMHGVLCVRGIVSGPLRYTEIERLTGLPVEPPGMVSSTTLLRGSS